MSESLDEAIADGMAFSVLCNEDFPFYDAREAEVLNEGTYLGAVQVESLSRICPLWPTRAIPDDFKQPVRSDVPVLLLSGEGDPVTPPENGDLVAEHLSQALHIVAPGQGHIVIHRGCLQRLATDFVEAGSLSGIDPSCADGMKPQPFFTSFAGPLP